MMTVIPVRKDAILYQSGFIFMQFTLLSFYHNWLDKQLQTGIIGKNHILLILLITKASDYQESQVVPCENHIFVIHIQ
jgi:hypothetical protein